VVDAWLANAGDGAISLATERRLRGLAPDASILHAADHSHLLADNYPELRLLPPLAELTGVLPPRAESGWTVEHGRLIVSQADAVLSQGGGFLMDRYRPVARLHSYSALAEMDIPIAFCAQSISDFSDLGERRILARAFGRATAISVRDRASAQNVMRLASPTGGVATTADEAFSLFWAPPPPTAGRGLGLVVTAHLRDWAEQVLSGQDDLIAAMAEMVKTAVRVSDPEPVVLFSTAQGLGQHGIEDDGDVIREVFSTLPGRFAARVHVVDGYLSPHRCCELISGLRALVSMRMHPVIFGLSLGVPSLLLLDDFKATAQFPELGLGEYLGSPALAGTSLEAAITSVFNPGAARGRDLWERLGEARRRCDANNAIVSRLLAAAGRRASSAPAV
jgi:hypothetical protein